MFEVGDLVRLKTGKSTQKVIEVGSLTRAGIIRTQYLSRLHYQDYLSHPPRWRDASDYVLVYEKEEVMSQLYQTKSEPVRFGTYIATNSMGQMVLEMKGGKGDVQAFDIKEIEEVMPYTIGMEMLANTKGEGRTSISVIAQPGQVEKNDIMLQLDTGVIWRVAHLDSKCRSPKENKSKWLKIPTEAVTFGSDE